MREVILLRTLRDHVSFSLELICSGEARNHELEASLVVVPYHFLETPDGLS